MSNGILEFITANREVLDLILDLVPIPLFGQGSGWTVYRL